MPSGGGGQAQVVYHGTTSYHQSRLMVGGTATKAASSSAFPDVDAFQASPGLDRTTITEGSNEDSFYTEPGVPGEADSQVAIMGGTPERSEEDGHLGIMPRDQVDTAEGWGVAGTGASPGTNPVGYQVGGGRGFRAPPPPNAPQGPPISTVKTKKKKKKKGSSKKHRAQSEEEPFDCAPSASTPTSAASPPTRTGPAVQAAQHVDGHVDGAHVRTPPTTTTKGKQSATTSQNYERMYFSESETSGYQTAQSVPAMKYTSVGVAGPAQRPFDEHAANSNAKSKAIGTAGRVNDANVADDGTIGTLGTTDSWRRAEEDWKRAEAEGGATAELEYDTVESMDVAEMQYRQAAAVVGGGGQYGADDGSSALVGASKGSPPRGGGGGTTKSILKSGRRRSHPWDQALGGGSNSKSRSAEVADNDSLFDFDDDARGGRGRRGGGRKNSGDDEDERYLRKTRSEDDRNRSEARLRGGRSTSYDEDESTFDGPNLEERAQQAWNRKNKGRPGDGRSKSAPRERDSGPQRGRRRSDRNSSVAFTGKDAVHHFDEDSTVYTRDSSYVSRGRGRRDRDSRGSDDDTTYSRRTLGTSATADTTYTKSYESEVEDFVRDMFFVGSGKKTVPGQRRHTSKQAYKDEESTFGPDYDDETYDESTLMGGTYGEESTQMGESQLSNSGTVESEENTRDPPTAKRRTRDDDMSVDTPRGSPCGQESPCEMDDNPLSAMWEFMEGGLGAVTEALGLSDPKNKEKAAAQSGKDGGAGNSGALAETRSPSTPSGRGGTGEASNSGLGGLVDYASDLLFAGAASNETGNSLDTASFSGGLATSMSMDNSVDKEAGLVELSLCAARAKHLTSGVSFDETAEIDVVNEIKFNVITTSLPLGLLFQENSAGCWVAKVFSSGNAANAVTGRAVEVGDQLAAVNGSSTIKLTVDEVCDMISSAPNPEEIELTFLRYVGPLHNGKKAMDASPVRRTISGSGLGKLRFSPKRTGSIPRSRSSPVKKGLSLRLSKNKSSDSAEVTATSSASPATLEKPGPTPGKNATQAPTTTKSKKKKFSLHFGRKKKS